MSSNKLKREELVNITNKFLDCVKEYTTFEIPDEMYVNYFLELKQKLTQYELEEDKRFVTYGRLDFLSEELSKRLKDKSLNHPNPAWKDKWDNRMGAFWDLADYIKGDRSISISQVPTGTSFREILENNDNYYEEGYICKQEKDILISMIKEIEEYINNNSNSQ